MGHTTTARVLLEHGALVDYPTQVSSYLKWFKLNQLTPFKLDLLENLDPRILQSNVDLYFVNPKPVLVY